MPFKKLVLGLILTFCGSTWVSAQHKTFTNVPAVNPLCHAAYISETPMEFIAGTTNQVWGEVRLDPMNILNNPSGYCTVDLRDLNSRLALRDQHMRELYLETHKYPTATFTLKSLSNTSATGFDKAKRITAQATGEFTLHGVTKTITVDISFTYVTEDAAAKNQLLGNLLRYDVQFPVRLSDYGIQIPEIRDTRVAEVMKIEVHNVLTDAPGGKIMDPSSVENFGK